MKIGLFESIYVVIIKRKRERELHFYLLIKSLFTTHTELSDRDYIEREKMRIILVRVSIF